MIRVRDATIDDTEILISLGTKMREESVVSYPPIDHEYARKWVELAVATPGVFLVAIAEDDGEPIGMITAAAGPYCFSPEIRTASDLLFVLPEHRGGWAAVRLVRKFNQWSDSFGATATVSVATGVTTERTGKFFEIMGFSPMEKMYRRDVYGS